MDFDHIFVRFLTNVSTLLIISLLETQKKVKVGMSPEALLYYGEYNSQSTSLSEQITW